MKTAIPVKEKGENPQIASEFGRTPFFAVVEGGQIEFVENPGAKSGGGAGAKASQLLITLNVEKVVLRKPPGPNAKQALEGAGISIEITDSKFLKEVL